MGIGVYHFTYWKAIGKQERPLPPADRAPSKNETFAAPASLTRMRHAKHLRGGGMTRLFLSASLAVSLHPLTHARADADKVQALLRREMRERRIPGLQVAVVRRGKIVLLRSFGVANLQDSVPVGDRSVFAANSCTKAFTGVAVMQLVEEGKIDLSAPVSSYLDELPAAWRPVTVRQLLTHVSGLPNILNVLDPSTGKLTGRDDEDAAWAKVRAMPLESPAGERFSYNQTNYVLLGKIIDKYSGQPFARFFGARQFIPAGMTNTPFGDSRDIIPRQAPSYRYVGSLDGHALGEDRLVFAYAEFPPFRRAASGLNSTAEDVARWLIALREGKLLKTKAAR